MAKRFRGGEDLVENGDIRQELWGYVILIIDLLEWDMFPSAIRGVSPLELLSL